MSAWIVRKAEREGPKLSIHRARRNNAAARRQACHGRAGADDGRTDGRRASHEKNRTIGGVGGKSALTASECGLALSVDNMEAQQACLPHNLTCTQKYAFYPPLH